MVDIGSSMLGLFAWLAPLILVAIRFVRLLRILAFSVFRRLDFFHRCSRWLHFSVLPRAKRRRPNIESTGGRAETQQTMNNAPPQENAVGGMAVAAGGNVAVNAAAPVANQQEGNDGSNIEASSNNSNGNENGEATDAENTAAASGPAARYSLRKRKPLLALQGGNSTAADGSSNSNSAVQSAAGAADAFGYVNTANLTDRQFEKMLAKYEEDGVRERAQKKLRLERGYGDDDYPYEAPPEGCPPFHTLPKEAIQLVFELLPSVRSVFNLAFRSKYMLSFVEERVSRAAYKFIIVSIVILSLPSSHHFSFDDIHYPRRNLFTKKDRHHYSGCHPRKCRKWQ